MMYKLDLFIIRSGNTKKLWSDKLIESFAPSNIKINKIRLKTFSSELIREFSCEPYYAVFFDNEILEERLAKVLPLYLESIEHGIYDVIKCLKKSGDTIIESPRIFKKGIILEDNSLLPINLDKLKFIRALDGWIKSND